MNLFQGVDILLSFECWHTQKKGGIGEIKHTNKAVGTVFKPKPATNRHTNTHLNRQHVYNLFARKININPVDSFSNSKSLI